MVFIVLFANKSLADVNLRFYVNSSSQVYDLPVLCSISYKALALKEKITSTLSLKTKNEFDFRLGRFTKALEQFSTRNKLVFTET